MAPLSFDDLCLLIGRKEAEKLAEKRDCDQRMKVLTDGHYLRIRSLEAAYQECAKMAAEENAKLAAENASLKQRLEAARRLWSSG